MICVLDSDANALLAGIDQRVGMPVFRVLSSWAVRTAAMNTESCGLLDAAL